MRRLPPATGVVGLVANDFRDHAGCPMETVFDWLTVATFIVLAILYLQRSSMPDPPDKVLHYLPPAIACAVVNYVGNHGYVIVAVALLVGIFLYIYYVLKPMRRP
jgi:hypothetical protein